MIGNPPHLRQARRLAFLAATGLALIIFTSPARAALRIGAEQWVPGSAPQAPSPIVAARDDLLQTSLAKITRSNENSFDQPLWHNGKTDTGEAWEITSGHREKGFKIHFDLERSPGGYDINEIRVFTAGKDTAGAEAQVAQSYSILYQSAQDAGEKGKFRRFWDVLADPPEATTTGGILMTRSFDDSGVPIIKGVGAIMFAPKRVPGKNGAKLHWTENWIQEIDILGTAVGGEQVANAPETPAVATKTKAKAVPVVEPLTPDGSPNFPATFHAPSTTVQPSISALSDSESRRRFNEDELEFRFFRNVKLGKAIEAAVVDADPKSGHMHLYLRGGKNFVLPIADYHDEDKAYIADWLSWSEIKAKGESATGENVPAASAALASAFSLRLRTAEKRGKVESEKSQNNYPTEHEVTVQVVTGPNAPSGILNGQLQLIAYVANSLSDARLDGDVAVAALDSDSNSLEEVAIPPLSIHSFTPGKTDNQVFKFTTKSVKGKSTLKEKNKKAINFRWSQDQSLVGVRVRLLVDDKLAAEAVYPSDLDRLVKGYD